MPLLHGTSVKCDLDGDIRRFRKDTSLENFAELKKYLEDVYEKGDLVIKYKDDEGDLVTMANERDLDEASDVTCNPGMMRLKLFVKEASSKVKKEQYPMETVIKGGALEPMWLLKQYKKASKAQWKEAKEANKEALRLKPWKTQGDKPGNPVKQMARFVNHVTLQEGEKIPAGERRTKTWRVRNDSPRTWPEGPIQLVYVSGNAADRLSPEDAYPVEAKLAPGEETLLSVDITAPSAPGLYQGFWRLRGPKGCKFGQRLGCSILVNADEALISDLDPDSSSDPDLVENEDSDGFVDLGPSSGRSESENELQPVDRKCGARDKWAKELASLRQAGFDNDGLSLKLLKKYDGNVAKTAKKLAKKNLKCVKKVTKTVRKLEDLTIRQAKLFAAPSSAGGAPATNAPSPAGKKNEVADTLNDCDCAGVVLPVVPQE